MSTWIYNMYDALDLPMGEEYSPLMTVKKLAGKVLRDSPEKSLSPNLQVGSVKSRMPQKKNAPKSKTKARTNLSDVNRRKS